MKRCAVIGSPIEHSLSPLLHRTAYELLGLSDQFRYDRFDVTPERLAGFLAGCGPEWVGLSVTAPTKQALLAHGIPDQVSAELRAANTLIFGRDGAPNRIYNTDVTGFLRALADRDVTTARSAILLGNGATARSALWAFRQLGIKQVLVLARNAERAQQSLAPVAEPAGIELIHQPLGGPVKLPAGFGDRADLLVATVPAELPADYAAALAAQSKVVFEVVYLNYPTPLDLAARAAGVLALDALDMLVAQAIDQIRLMTGRSVEPEPLVAACRAEVLNRQGAK